LKLARIFVFPDLKKDLPASIAVFLVAIPLCLGIASASGSPILSGIIAGIVGGIVVGSISNSRLSVSGPAAGLTAIVFAAITELQYFETFLLAGIIAGCLQIFFGLIKGGILGNYIPVSIIKGLLAAIGLILIFKQFPHVVGYRVEDVGKEIIDQSMHNPSTEFLTDLGLSFKNIQPGLFIVGFFSLIIQILWEKNSILSKIPSSLVAVLVGTSLAYSFEGNPNLQLSELHYVNIPKINTLLDVQKAITLPNFTEILNLNVWKYGVILAVVASIETLLCIEAMDKLDPEKQLTSANRELLAQGFGNFLSAFLGGIPLTAVIVRGSVNLNSGAKTKYSAIFHGSFILLSLIYFTEILNLIPLASLAAVLCFTGYKLTSLNLYKVMYKKGTDQFIPFLATVIGILFTDILYGTIFGGIIAVGFILKDVFDSPVVKVLSKTKITKVFLGESVTFLHKAKIKKNLESIEPHSNVYIDCRKSKYIHPDIREYILEYQKAAKSNQISVIIQGIERLSPQHEKSPKVKLQLDYRRMLEDNKDWVWEVQQDDPHFFENGSFPETPEFLVIACSEMKLSPITITKVKPGIMIMHKNLGNLIQKGDTNFAAILEHAIINLKIREIIICGHSDCQIFHLSEVSKSDTAIYKWLKPIREFVSNQTKNHIKLENSKLQRVLSEEHVREQIRNLAGLPIIIKSQKETGFPILKGWIFQSKNGIIREILD
jgi:carbonic anhydrase